VALFVMILYDIHLRFIFISFKITIIVFFFIFKAFSHFTFEASCHEQIVVDIQGVGDLYTDPQIHTSLGLEYGGKSIIFFSKISMICPIFF
jgi:hypothetical protein